MPRKRTIGGMDLYFPRDIEDTFDKETGTLCLNLLYPGSNMQENQAAFEGWCLVLKANDAFEKVELSFDPVKMDKEDYFHNLSPKQQHYLRFLYRVSKFEQQFKDWFSVSKNNQDELEFFNKSFNRVRKVNTPPDSVSEYNHRKGKEHVLEKAFVLLPEFRKANGITYPVYDQFPNGLFVEKVSRENRIFNTGYFDLWGINEDGELCIFELKEPKNSNVGIISELYFYSNFASDLFFERNRFQLIRNDSKFRGYQTVMGPLKGQIHGIFLVPHFHVEIERILQSLLEMLNSNTKIKFSALKFDWSKELQEELKDKLDRVHNASNPLP